jgi:hypothetical protein
MMIKFYKNPMSKAWDFLLKKIEIFFKKLKNLLTIFMYMIIFVI